jgi:hypothetical protein
MSTCSPPPSVATTVLRNMPHNAWPKLGVTSLKWRQVRMRSLLGGAHCTTLQAQSYSHRHQDGSGRHINLVLLRLAQVPVRPR